MNRILTIAKRECGIIFRAPIYAFCMVVFPILAIVFFTTLLGEGQPSSIPVGVVDQDNTQLSRSLVRRLDSFQSSKVVARYATVSDARRAIQQNQIYGFLYIPKGTADALFAKRQPSISYYYSGVSMVAGSMLYKDLKTSTMLTSAEVGAAKLSMLGKTDREIETFLQPISLDLHQIANPQMDYNVYLSTTMVPGIMMLFILLLSAYALGSEIKFDRSKELMKAAGGDIRIALIGKYLPHVLVYFIIFVGFELYAYYGLGFPHPPHFLIPLFLALFCVLACIGFGIFMFGLMPSLRMSMSICSLWGVLSITICGATFPLFAMHPMIQALAWLFPLRHYYMIYQLNILNQFPPLDASAHYLVLLGFCILPFFVLKKLKNALLEYVYLS